MKKLILLMSIVMAVFSCGSKSPTDGRGIGTDREAIDSTDSQAIQSDGVEAAPADLWTEDAVKQHVRKMYSRLNSLAATGNINLSQMDEQFCTGYYLGLKHNIARHDADAQGDMRFYGDESGYRWWAGVGTPLQIVSLEAELLTGNMARARVRFKTNPKVADIQKGQDTMTLELWMENGRWRVNNFYAPEAFGEEGYLGMMETYAREHDIPLESDNEQSEGAPA